MPALSTPTRRIGTLVIGVSALAWLGAVVFGQRVMLNYDYTAAAPGAPPSRWPKASVLRRTEGLSTMVLVAHPHCPCTRATVEELARLMARLHGRATADVVFVRPRGFTDEWEKSDLWQSAARIPDVTVWSDADGVEATRFGALASGQTMLYGPAGDLQFSGGITASRGHAGDSAGQSAIFSLVTMGQSPMDHASVFGCSLRNPERAAN